MDYKSFNTIHILIDEMTLCASLFSVFSNKDFSRNRILGFKETISIILGMAGKSLNKELYDHFKNTPIIPTKSAFKKTRFY